MPRAQDTFPTVNSGDLVSSDIALIGAKSIGLIAPLIDSAQLFLQAAFGTAPVSADFKRVGNAAGSGDFIWDVTVGDKAMSLTDLLAAFSQARIELSAAQTDTRTFALTAKI